MIIEMVLPSLPVAGMETMVVRLCRRLASRGHRVGVTCIVEPGELAADLQAAGIRVTLVETPGFATNARPRALARHLAAIAPDVLHIHSGAWLKAAMAGRQSSRPFTVYTAHGHVHSEPWHYKYFERAAAYLTDRVVSVSEQLCDTLVERGVPASKISVIINGIDTDAFRPQPPNGIVRNKLGIGAETFLVGTVARLEPIKNQKMLIDGVAAARAAGCDCQAVLVGDGSLRGELQQQAHRLGIADKVHFWGIERDVTAIYPDLDAFALTSNQEGTSISMLEAMATGLCSIATAVGGNIDLLDDGSCGELVTLDRTDQLAAAIARLTAEPERRRALGRNARARVENCFSEIAMVERYEDLYQRRAIPRTQTAQLRTG